MFAPPLIRRPAAGIVLIVEDHLLVQITATARIEDGGLSTLVAGDADEAMAILTSRDDVAAVFTDIDMPGSMDGLALAAIIRRRWPQIQVVVTSGQRPSSMNP